MSGVEQLTLSMGHGVGVGNEQTEDEQGSYRCNGFRGHGVIVNSVATATEVTETTADDLLPFNGSGDGRSRNSDDYEMRIDIQEEGAVVAAAPGVGGNLKVSASPRADGCGIGGARAGTSKTEADMLVEHGTGGVGGDGDGGGDVEEGIGITYDERNTAASEIWHINSSSYDINTDMAKVRRTRFTDARRARTIKLWDPVKQLELYSAATTASGQLQCTMPGIIRDCSKTSLDFGSVSDPRTGPSIDTEANASAFGGEAPFSVGGTGTGGSVGGGSKPAGRAPVQPGRVAWCEDGETLFILSHEGKAAGGSRPLWKLLCVDR